MVHLLLKHHRLSLGASVQIHQLPERGIARGLTPEKRDEIVALALEKIQDASEKTKRIVTYLLNTLANAYMLYLAASEEA